MSDFFDNWTVQVRKGMLETYTLSALAQKERYGYELVKMLVEMPGLSVSEGTLYPILSRLRTQGLVTTRLVESAEGPARKYYALTAEGRKVLRLMEDYLAEMNAVNASCGRKERRYERMDRIGEVELEQYLKRVRAASGNGAGRGGSRGRLPQSRARGNRGGGNQNRDRGGCPAHHEPPRPAGE